MAELLDEFTGDAGIMLAKMFNKKPKNAIQHIEDIVQGQIDAAQLEAQSRYKEIDITPEKKRKMVAEQIAAFFIAQKDNLDLSAVGDFLGDDPGIKANIYNSLVLAEMANGIPMKDVEYLEALREFLGKFMLPGEAQKVDRIMVAFAEKFMAENPDHPEFKRSAADITDEELQEAIREATKEAKRKYEKETAQEIARIEEERGMKRPTKASIANENPPKTKADVSSVELIEAQDAYELETIRIIEELKTKKLYEFNENPPILTKEEVAEQKTKDLPYQIAFAVMTLQTSLHNPSVPEEQRLSFEQFKSLSQGFDEKLSDEFLKKIYYSVKDNAFEVTFSPSSPGISFPSDKLESDAKFKELMENVTSSSVKYGKSMDASTVFPGIKQNSGYKVTFAKPKSWIQKIFGGYTGAATVSKDGKDLATINISRGGLFSRLFGKKSTLSIDPIAQNEIEDQEEALEAAASIAAQFETEPEFKTTFAYETAELEQAYAAASNKDFNAEYDWDYCQEGEAPPMAKRYMLGSAPGSLLSNAAREEPSAHAIRASAPASKGPRTGTP